VERVESQSVSWTVPARRRGPEIAAANPAPAPAAPARFPNPELWKNRVPSAPSQPPPLPLNSFPRLAVDPSGTVFLAFRTVAGLGRTPVGTVWNEAVVYFDGAEWKGPVAVCNSDGLLDARPALISPSAGALVLVTTTDHRQSPPAGGARRAAGADAIQSDLYAAEMRVEPGGKPVALASLAPEKPAPPAAEVKAELDQIALMRGYRVELGAEKLELVRGEFHRHTEMSGDGGRDGPLIDAYRYMIDAAYMDWVGCCDHDNGGGREYYCGPSRS